MFRRKGTNKNKLWDSLVAQWLGHNSFSAEGLASVPGGGMKISQTTRPKERKKKMCVCVCAHVCVCILACVQHTCELRRAINTPDEMELYQGAFVVLKLKHINSYYVIIITVIITINSYKLLLYDIKKLLQLLLSHFIHV